MEWIEHLLHVSPDRGNGAVELVLYSGPVIVGLRSLLRRRRRHSGPKDAAIANAFRAPTWPRLPIVGHPDGKAIP
jgi:hypothetical protein